MYWHLKCVEGPLAVYTIEFWQRTIEEYIVRLLSTGGFFLCLTTSLLEMLTRHFVVVFLTKIALNFGEFASFESGRVPMFHES